MITSSAYWYDYVAKIWKLDLANNGSATEVGKVLGFNSRIVNIEISNDNKWALISSKDHTKLIKLPD